MPIEIKQISPRRYEVVNALTGVIHSTSTSLKKAQAQKRLLDAIDHGFKPKKNIVKKQGPVNPWIAHVHQVAQQKGISYRDALKVASKSY